MAALSPRRCSLSIRPSRERDFWPMWAKDRVGRMATLWSTRHFMAWRALSRRLPVSPFLRSSATSISAAARNVPAQEKALGPRGPSLRRRAHALTVMYRTPATLTTLSL